jgi:hypothetical protein
VPTRSAAGSRPAGQSENHGPSGTTSDQKQADYLINFRVIQYLMDPNELQSSNLFMPTTLSGSFIFKMTTPSRPMVSRWQ